VERPEFLPVDLDEGRRHVSDVGDFAVDVVHAERIESRGEVAVAQIAAPVRLGSSMDADLRSEPPEPRSTTTHTAASDLVPQLPPREKDRLSCVGYESAHPWHRSDTDTAGYVSTAT